MTITFISTWQALLWSLAAMAALVIYMWKVRPVLAARPEFHRFYTLADSFWARVWAWLKIRWDLSAGAVVMSLPSVWNGILDAVIWVSITLGEVMPLLQGIDMSDWVLAWWVKPAFYIAGILFPYIRGKLIEKDKDAVE